ncbi:putative cucumisin [Lupinus albus]|uniref:Putative cucumisin n=1 Tax=Lupinus albus TaxID=3870 RepID=A0A6A4RAG2_LUPAL|nr:putative cucumisin [Lupinus albus]
MVRYSFIVFCVSFILACTLFSKCDASHDNPKLYIVYMGSLPKTSYSLTSNHLSMMQEVFNDDDATNSLIQSYQRSFNGFAAMLTNQQKEKLSQMEGVVSVFPSRKFQLQTTRSWDFLGLPKSVNRSPAKESDVVVGVLDTGIWPESDSFNDQDFGPVPKHWKGVCAGGTNFTCNKKIIGARYYTDKSARDLNGHGTHTASTAAGNYVPSASFYGLAQGTARGGVPLARIATYKTCNELGCDGAAILSAFDDAIADGVNIISVSLGGSSQLPFHQDPIAIGSFHAMKRGILTVNAAGNSGPRPTSSSSVAPWILTVAASTIDRKFIDKVVLENGKTLTGISINSFTFNGTQILIAKKNGGPKCLEENANACNCFDSNLVDGKIILCDKGHGILGEDYDSVNPAGIIIQSRRKGLPAFVEPLPSLSLSETDFQLLKSYVNSTNNPKAEILKSETVTDDNAPMIIGFSSRGPNTIAPEILKPDISAPGVDILASFSPAASPSGIKIDKRSVKYNIISGTSMACPHVSGIAAYLKTFHLDWSPAAIKSALMTSAQPMKGSEDEIGEYAYGSGHVNPIPATNPGLVYDISLEDYVQMLCNLGYNNEKVKLISGKDNACSEPPNRSLVRDLNYPALAIDVEPTTSFTINFNRTVTNVGLANSTYKATILPNPRINVTVVPKILSFKSVGEKLSFTVTVIGDKLTTALTSSLVWSDGTHNVRSPIVIDVSN